MASFTVGFDLDLTLVDSRPGIAATYRVLREQTGVPIDVDLAVGRLGPPLEWELAQWYPAERVAARAAGVHAVGVLTGPASASQLAHAGADVILDDLRDFPAWLAGIQLGR